MYGKIIKDLRKVKGLTQQQLAKELDISLSNICKYELEQLDLSTDTLIKLCKYFEVSADYILGLKDE